MRCIWLLCLSVSLCAQTVNISSFGAGTVSLAGQWRFQPGDDPQWANPNFDDSGWKLVQVPLSLSKQGYPNFSGFGWYRIKLHSNPEHEPIDLSMAITGVAWAGEFFAGGVRIGRFGKLPPDARLYLDRPMFFDIPKDCWRKSQDLVLAVRIWVDPKLARMNKSGFLRDDPNDLSAPRIGLPPVIRDLVDARKRTMELKRLPPELTKCAELILAVYLIGLFFTETKRREYLILGLNFAGDVLGNLVYWVGESSFLLTIHILLSLWFVMPPLLFTSGIYGDWALFGCRVGRLLRWSLAVFLLHNVVLYSAFYLGFWKIPSFGALSGVFAPAFCCILIIFLLRRAWATSGELRWLALSFIPFLTALLVTNVTARIPGFSQYRDPLYLFGDTTMLCAVIAFGFLLMRRSGHARAEQDRLHAEMETARQVQQLMLPAQSVIIPNLQVHTAYLPAQEVGGDFFQISQIGDDSLLMIIGDVSGKGLKAALSMSLLVGLWQDVIDAPEQSPRDVLLRLNKHLLRRIHGEFVTCLCIRLDADGSLLIANAGHLAPYIDGQELPVASGLPLGITSEVEYNETRHVLGMKETLVLVTDGVVEARDKSGNFFGFERLRASLSQRMETDAIARRAQQFGQEDDITVISVSRQAMAVEPAVQLQSAALAV
ncbi:MAG: serine/threonine-protein phosphatase [Acidobacteriaceae bacterium]|nr:serine/threonine-protein phosphatase [Acidobacteriaceae bacterium]